MPSDVFDSWLSSEHDVPQVVVEGGVSEAQQLLDFANATIGRSRDEKWAVSIATYIDLPRGLDADAVRLTVQAALDQAAKASPMVMFDAKVGPSLDYEQIVEDEARGDYDEEEE